VVEEGTIALSHFRTPARRRRPGDRQEQIWYVDDLDQKRLQTKWDIPATRLAISIDGDPNLVIDVDFPQGCPSGTRRRRVVDTGTT